MRIAIHDADAEHLNRRDKFPNYALMKISAYHKARGDTVEWFTASSRIFPKRGQNMKREAMFSNKKELWETPQELFDKYDSIYHFQTDVCALPENAKCAKYFTPEIDGLKQEWTGVCWCNPPYGRKIGDWVKKAVKSRARVVMLLPARTDTKWFHDYCLAYGKIEFLRGRIKFVGAKYSAPFPSMIVVFEEY